MRLSQLFADSLWDADGIQVPQRVVGNGLGTCQVAPGLGGTLTLVNMEAGVYRIRWDNKEMEEQFFIHGPMAMCLDVVEQ